MPVYLTFQADINEESRKYDKTMAVQKCGDYPYEIAIRFAQCCLRCGACFAAGYSWVDEFQKNRRVHSNILPERILKDFNNIIVPPSGGYNWMRILGGEPFLNDEYAQYVMEIILKTSTENSKKFNNGIIIQTNGIHLGRGGTRIVEDNLRKLYQINPSVTVAIEVSIKGTNPDEFNLLTQSAGSMFEDNVKAYYNLRGLSLPNLRPVIIAGFGVSESFLLTQGRKPKSMITILFDEKTPVYHPSIWSDKFHKLYDDFIRDYSAFDPIFNKMPMYGIKDQFEYGWVQPAIARGKRTFGWRWYDSDYVQAKKPEIEAKFDDIIDKFFLVSNQKYYSTLVNQAGYQTA